MDYVHAFFVVQFLSNQTAHQTTTTSARSLMECSRFCGASRYQCGAFIFDPITSNCTLIGQFEISTHAPTKYWIKRDHCPIQNGYLHLYNGNHGDHLCVTLEMTDKKKWEDAEEDCRTRGDNLVSLDTEEKTLLVTNYLSTRAEFDEYWWIGLKDRTNTNVYTWKHGRPLTYDNWNDDQPDYWFNGQDDDCVVLETASKNFTWSDFNCFNNLCYFICDRGQN